ncbi:hypothetical protein B7486_71375 [cyanobacterium TDX16]|nr:hypothetical protein B7486_71375 [cyanobacterium TDX16]
MWAVALVLLAVAARFGLRFQAELPPVELSTGEVEPQIRASAEALVALFVFFPALLFTQVERFRRTDLLEAKATQSGLTYLFLALAVPLVAAVVVVGDVNPGWAIGIIVVGGCSLLALGAWYGFKMARSQIDQTLRARANALSEHWILAGSAP